LYTRALAKGEDEGKLHRLRGGLAPSQKNKDKGGKMRKEGEEVLGILQTIGASIIEGHFVLASGEHTDRYINKDDIYRDPWKASLVGKEIASRFRQEEIDVVVGPAIAGVILAQWVAYHYDVSKWLEHQPRTLAAYAEEKNKKRVFCRGYKKVIPGKNVLIVDDVLASGGTVRGLIKAVKKLGGKIVGVAVIVNRGKITAKSLGVPKLVALVNIPMKSFPKKKCPPCKEGIPINTEFGRGKDLLAK